MNRDELSTLATVTAVSFVALWWSPAQAQALEHNQCAAPQEMAQLLREEGQGFIAAMDRLVVNDQGETEHRAEFITANQGGQKWYLIRANAELGGQASQMCVSHIGRSLEISDYRFAGLPTVTPYEFNEREALAQCGAQEERTGEKRDCGYRDSMLEIAERDLGERLALQGLLEDASGTARGLFSVIADPVNHQAYRVLNTADAGATTIVESGVRFALEPSIISQFDQTRN